MKTYSSFRPTSCDVAGLALPEQQDWFVGPVGINRDSDILTESNWEVVTKDLLENFPNDVEIHEFGHWACGWFRIILIRPDSIAYHAAERWESTLADCVVASSEDYSDRRYEAIGKYWAQCSLKERVSMLSELGLNIFAARRADSIPEKVWDKLYESDEFQ